MDFLRRFWDVASRIDPNAREPDEGKRFPICSPDALDELFRGAGLCDVRCDPIGLTTEFSNFDE